MRLSRGETWVLLGVLGALVLLNTTTLGASPWAFRPGEVQPQGPLGPLVELAGEKWNTNMLKAVALLSGLGVAAAAAATLSGLLWRRWMAVALAAAVVVSLLVPAVTLQVALREATAPWFFTNDSTYQIELAGDLVLDGENPYGHDFIRSGLERFYSLDGSVPRSAADEHVALSHFAYFPGTVVTAALWRLLARPWDDYRFFVALATLAALPAALVFPGPFGWRVAAGAALAGNPLAVRGAWFGTADAPALLMVLLAFALLARQRYLPASVALGGAVVIKQFALVAVPFVAVVLLRRASRTELLRSAGAAALVVTVGLAEFVAWGPRAFWDDTIAYGAGTYRIVGYGLSELLLRAGLIDERTDYYPFAWLALFVWLPFTAWVAVLTWRARRLISTALLGFGLSLFVLVYIARSFHGSYLLYPLAALIAAALAAAVERADPDRRYR